MIDLQKAIQLLRKVIHSNSQNRSVHARWLNNFANRIENRNSKTKMMIDQKKAILNYQLALRQFNSVIITRILS